MRTFAWQYSLALLILTAVALLGKVIDPPLSEMLTEPPISLFETAEVKPVPVSASMPPAPVIEDLAGQHPWMVTLFCVIGVLRFFVKPAVAAAHWYAKSTASIEDDLFVESIERHPAMRVLLFLADWFGSIKPRR